MNLPPPDVRVQMRSAAQLAEHLTVVLRPHEVKHRVIERAVHAPGRLVVGYVP
jgi:hypothetical protein